MKSTHAERLEEVKVSKKFLWSLLGLMVVVSLLVVGCSPAAAPSGGGGEQGGGAAPAEEEEEAPAQASGEVIEWIGQSHAGGITQQHHSLQRVAEEIGAASGGRLMMSVEVGGGIAPASQEFQAVDAGTLDFAVTCFMYWRDQFPACGIFTMVSGGMTPMEAMSWFREGGGSELADEMVEGSNVHIVKNGGWMGPPEAFLMTNKELKTANDLKGLQIRGAGDAAEILSRMGAGMVMMAAGEVFEAMQRGVIDAFEVASPTLNWDLGLQEAADYLYLSGARQPYEYNPFIVNVDRWNELPDDLKAIVQQVNQAETIRAYDELLRLDLEAIAKFKDYGTKVLPLPKAVEDAYLAEAKAFYDEMAAQDEFRGRVLDSYWSWQAQLHSVWSAL
jgi:TRAP-type mannitol/chloroaromatic compound transport system substrate-binding protein